MTIGTEFWSAISGAVVGGLIALAIQLVAIRAAKNERTAAKIETSEALARSILFKVTRIMANLYNLHLHVEKSFAAEDPNSHSNPWEFVLPLAGLPADVHFSTEEMSLAFSFEDPDLFDKLMSLDMIHNNLIDIFQTYNGMRNDMKANMPAKMEGSVGKSSFTQKEWLVVEPKIVEMNQLLTNIRARAKMDYDDSKTTIDDLLTAMDEKLGLKLDVNFKAEKLAALVEATKEPTE